MVTPESLAALGIESQTKSIQPDWYFIVGSFLFINAFVYLVIGLFFYLQAKSLVQGTQSEIKRNTGNIYYDKIKELEAAEQNKRRCCSRFRKSATMSESKIVPHKEMKISYNDLEQLLTEFSYSVDLLKR
mmetsp:Transcript_48770/g.66368  ORF Transcript_48770/g.66368 Transcript_48770/m.66368 type:complete len:130 (+) Transcript_48770:7554-7943(+)